MSHRYARCSKNSFLLLICYARLALIFCIRLNCCTTATPCMLHVVIHQSASRYMAGSSITLTLNCCCLLLAGHSSSGQTRCHLSRFLQVDLCAAPGPPGGASLASAARDTSPPAHHNTPPHQHPLRESPASIIHRFRSPCRHHSARPRASGCSAASWSTAAKPAGFKLWRLLWPQRCCNLSLCTQPTAAVLRAHVVCSNRRRMPATCHALWGLPHVRQLQCQQVGRPTGQRQHKQPHIHQLNAAAAAVA
jgi:hypothetical protein